MPVATLDTPTITHILATLYPPWVHPPLNTTKPHQTCCATQAQASTFDPDPTTIIKALSNIRHGSMAQKLLAHSLTSYTYFIDLLSLLLTVICPNQLLKPSMPTTC